MQMVRQYAVPHDQVVQVTVPKEFNDKQIEIQVILVDETSKKKLTKKSKPSKDLSYLIGSAKHLTPEQNAKIDAELKEMRDSWERDIF